MADFPGVLSRDFESGPFPDPNVGEPVLPSAGDQPYPPGPWNPIGAVPTMAPFERISTFDLSMLGVDPGDPNTVGLAENGSAVSGPAQLVNAQTIGPIKGFGSLSNQVQNDWFEKWHIFPGELALGNILTTQIRNLEIFNSFRNEARTWQGFTNNAGAGITITNLPALPTVLQAQESFINIVQVSTLGPPLIDGTLDFDVDLDPPDVIVIPITGVRIIVFPFRPQAPIAEELEFLTDIIEHADGSEQRLSLRQAPRQSFDFRILVDDSRTRDTINNILFDWQTRVFGVPIWWETKPLLAPLATTDTVIQVDTTDADFRDGGLVTVYDDNFYNKTVEILTVNPTNLVLQAEIGQAFDAVNTLVIPARTAYTLPRLQDSRYSRGVTTFDFNFQVLDNVDLSDSAAFPTYQGVGQTTPKPLLDGLNFMPGQTIGEGNRQRVEQLDHETGPFAQFTPWLKGKPTYQFGFEAQTAAEVWDVRQLVHFLRGSQLSFYVPTGRTDIKPLVGIPDTSTQIDFENVGFDQFVGGTTPRSDIRIIRTNGNTSLHQIVGTNEVSADVERITINPGVSPSLPLDQIERIEIVTLSRIVSDRVRFVHRRPGDSRIDLELLGVPA